jgi:hypothetical protein
MSRLYKASKQTPRVAYDNERLKRVAKKQFLTLERFVRSLDLISPRTAYRVLYGECPNMDTVDYVARHVGLSLQKLLLKQKAEQGREASAASNRA